MAGARRARQLLPQGNCVGQHLDRPSGVRFLERSSHSQAELGCASSKLGQAVECWSLESAGFVSPQRLSRRKLHPIIRACHLDYLQIVPKFDHVDFEASRGRQQAKRQRHGTISSEADNSRSNYGCRIPNGEGASNSRTPFVEMLPMRRLCLVNDGNVTGARALST